jgi:hypothetical protein
MRTSQPGIVLQDFARCKHSTTASAPDKWEMGGLGPGRCQLRRQSHPCASAASLHRHFANHNALPSRLALQNSAASQQAPVCASALVSSHLELVPAAPRLHQLDTLLKVGATQLSSLACMFTACLYPKKPATQAIYTDLCLREAARPGACCIDSNRQRSLGTHANSTCLQAADRCTNCAPRC